MSIRNWKNFKVPGQKLDVFTRSNPIGDEIKDTYVEGLSPGRKKKRKRLRLRDAADALRDARRL